MLVPTIAAGGLFAGSIFTNQPVHAALDEELHPAKWPWQFDGAWDAYDAASLRRGYEVYRQVCSTCHSLKYMYFRYLVGVSHTEDQAKALAASYKIQDGPNDKGEMFERPGKLLDKFPQPYPNEEAARYANNGAYPPDLTLITNGRHDGVNYVFSLLTGYGRDLPHGVAPRPGAYFNPYFVGFFLGMPPPLRNEGLDYEDGTPATMAQQAKDVTTFLTWAADIHQDTRKKMMHETWYSVMICCLGLGYLKRFRWGSLKTSRRYWVPNPRKH
eukprot:TRINITY_DN5195_c0_g1_i5.p1 TRINITY_DN5195_c0_g1~~TRINITY_DN5195_c0_g1_i5.p1  ORF type:complete len:316 (+),score=32.72 TRINITY_DN5195_c0_g1_i5:138-950(+)